MTTQRAHLPSINGTEVASTSRQPGTPLVEDQIRDYRRSARARYEAQRMGRNLVNIGRTIIGRRPREHTLALLMDPEVELRRSMQERARTVPAEVLYMTRRDDIHHRVYHYRSEEGMLITGSDQQDRTFITEESYEHLAQAEIEYIHLGILQVRFQILHRRYAGTMALLVFRDTRWNSDDRSIIAAMEVDLSEGNQLIYIMPDMMMTIKDFYRHIQMSIQTRGYDSWTGAEANLLITRSITSRLSNTPNVGFAFQVNKVAEYLRSKGIKAIDAMKYSTGQFQHSRWNLRPSTVVIPVLPSTLVTSTNYDGSTTLQFGDYQAASSSRPPIYNNEDDEIDEEQHIVAVITIIDDQEDDYPALAAVEKQIFPENMVGEEEAIISSFLQKLELSEDEESYYGDLESEPRSHYEINHLDDDYPELLNVEKILSTNESAISNYRVPQDEEMTVPGYAPAGSSRGWATNIDDAMLHQRKPKRWDNSSEWFQLPSANARQGSIFVMPYDFDVKVFERWESSVLVHLADKNFDTPEDKVIYIENLLGESEKKAFMTWRMKYLPEFEALKAAALGNNGTQNILNQIRMIFFLENPKVGTTDEQDAAYKTIKSLVCNEMTDKAVYRYMNDYFHLASKSGRMWANEELSTEFFTKLPRHLGDKVEKAFKERHPTNSIGVTARIAFTRNYLKDMCQEALFQSQLKKMNFCGNTPVHGIYGKNKEGGFRKYGVRKNTSYKGKPHKSHIRIGKQKHLNLRKKDCKCFACGETGHYASECTNPKKFTHRVAILESLDLQEGLEVVSVGMDESDVSDIYSISENEDNHQITEEWDVLMLQEEEIPEPSEYYIGEPGWRSQMKVSKTEFHCQHEWKFDKEDSKHCRDCKFEARRDNRMDCSKCQLTICALCTYHCFKILIPRKQTTPSMKHDWRELAERQSELLRKFCQREKELEQEVQELRREISTLKTDLANLSVIQETPEEDEEELQRLRQENTLLELLNQKQQKDIEALQQQNELLLQLAKIDKKEIESLRSQHPLPVLHLDDFAVTVVQPSNNLLNIKVIVEIDGKQLPLNAILDTGAAICVCNGEVIPQEYRRSSLTDSLIQGVNGATRVNEILKDGKLWVGDQYFRIPRTYIMPTMHKGLEFIIGMNFIKAMEGGLRIEKGEVTFYKLVTTVNTSPKPHEVCLLDELDLELPEYYDICAAIPRQGSINEEFISPSEIDRLKRLGFIGEEPLRHWKRNQIKCKLEIKNPDLIIEDRPLKHVTPAMKETMTKHVQRLLDIKVIRPSTSKHRTTAIMVNSGTEIDPITGAEKKGKERLVFNYKRLNDNTEKDQYSLPGINTIIARISHSKIYSKFDLKSGFHQVAMEEESIPWTAFWAINGLYEWLVMPFGLKNAPAIFQRKMDNCFRGTEKFIAVYIDDILIFSDSKEAHRTHLRQFITICEENGLVLSPTKMKIGVQQVDFLGATIGDSKVRLQPHIVKKVLETKEESLSETKALRRWLGILNYARAYIPDLGKILGPLYSKTSGKGERKLNHQDMKIIHQIKEKVKNLPELEVPPPESIILIETDGCMDGWGGICKWKLNKGEPRSAEKICAYASGRFNPIKGAIDAEIQAVIYSLEKFKIYYLDKRELILRTDSKAIVRFYEKCSEHKPSRVRWMTLTDYISGCGVKVYFEHIDGKDNTLADELSRLVQAILINKEESPIILSLIKATTEVLQKENPISRSRLALCISRALGNKYQVNFMTWEQPQLKCACGENAVLLTSHTSRNPGRRFYRCGTNTCHVWYWADLIEDYIAQLSNLQNLDSGQADDEGWAYQTEDLINPEDLANSDIDDPPEDSGLFHRHDD
ncbi:polyprotein III [Banana streak GF virus]|uniref:RNA-directed DNA polymerase n=3 Tax=root TaxID=1 RepID=Q6RSW7_9VIRU|nr:polyprotein [Banana streak GF virus]AAR86692.1 polyprotein III [Banana streak GF virus]